MEIQSHSSNVKNEKRKSQKREKSRDENPSDQTLVHHGMNFVFEQKQRKKDI